MSAPLTTLPVCIVEEIGFEGLEGITIEGLWKRISVRMRLALPLNDRLKNETWHFLYSSKCFEFYLLAEEREPLIIYDRMEYVDNAGSNEVESCPYNVYKYNPISTDTVRGSCEHFDARELIEKESIAGLTVDAVEETYGRRLVIVAAQDIRNNLLLPANFPPDLELTISIYCILERLGRARYNGELNQGKYSLSDICGDPIAAYSFKKKLKRYRLIECQVFHQNIDGTNMFSQLFHLPRFFSKYKSRVMLVMERIVEVLKSKPNCMAEYQEIQGLFDDNVASTLRRLTRSPLFHKIVINDTRFPYRAMYPNAPERRWKMKNRYGERSLHVLQLRDPNVDFDEIWAEQVADDDPDEEFNEQRGFLDQSHEVLEIPLLHQAYQYIGTTESAGATELEVGQRFGQSKLCIRSVIRKLLDLKIIEHFTTTCQRQMVRRYVWPKYHCKPYEFLLPDEPANPSNAMETSQNGVDGDASNNIANGEVYESTEYVPAATDDLFIKQENDAGNTIESKEIGDKVTMKMTEIDKTDYCSKSKRNPIVEATLSDRSKERLIYMHREIKSRIMYGDPALLYASLVQNEAARGLTDKLCRKTFFRLLSFLRKKGHIRLWRVEFQYQNKIRNYLYVGSREADVTFPLMKSYLEQAKSKFIMSIIDEKHRQELRKIRQVGESVGDTDNDTTSNTEIETPMDIPSKDMTVKRKTLRKVKRIQTTPTNRASNYGINPKFIRLRTLHEFLYYLVYDHKGADILDQEGAIDQVRQEAYGIADIESMPRIWNTGVNWKMFVSPLIKHDGFPNGWCLLSDGLYRMPLSVFIRIVNYAYKIRGLDEILAHPVKKHFPLQDLPIRIQQALFMGRKYIATMSYQLQRLCCLGLVQLGPHRVFKDQAYYFINRSAKLYDTTSSELGLHYITEKEYPETVYRFDTLDNVMSFWDDMYSVCMSTRLNRRSMGDGTTPAEKVLPERLMQCLVPIEPEDGRPIDMPYLPGDHRGAAGLDSYFFPHLERNWSFNPGNFKQKDKSRRYAGDELLASTAEPLTCGRLMRIKHDGMVRRTRLAIKTVPLHKLKTAVVRRRISVVRKTIGVRTRRTRNKYDDIDRIALQNMNKLRVDWNDGEDNFLLLCRVATMYLNPNPNRLVMPPQVIRDLIHWKCNSLNKTSLACRRRVTYIMKHLPTSRQIINRVMMCLNEIKQNQMIQQRYGDNFIDKLKQVYPDDDEFGEAFRVHYVDLVYILSNQFYNLTNTFESTWLILPNTIAEFKARFIEKADTIYDPDAMRYDNVESIEDISVATIITLIHSTMCCCHDKTSFSIQLYEIYKDFPEILLAKAMSRVRSDQLISHNKLTTGPQKAYNRCLPLSSKTYHLSVTYQQQMTTKIIYDIYDDAFAVVCDVFGEVMQPNDKYPLGQMNSGSCFLISELTRFDDYELQIVIPNRILLLDPSKRTSEEAIRGIRDRFHEIFSYIPKMDLEETTDYDIFPAPLPDSQESQSMSTETKAFIKKLDALSTDVLHFFCIIDMFGETKPLSEINISEDGVCSLDCIRKASNPYDGIMNKLTAKRDVWNRLNADQQQNTTLGETVTFGETAIVAIYSRIILNGSTIREENHAEHLNSFKQLLDIVDEVFVENDREMIDEDFGAEYDLRSDVKKRMYDGAQINEKIHKFQDFLSVNTCKLSLVPKNAGSINLKALFRKRDMMLENIVSDSNWSSEKRTRSLEDILQDHLPDDQHEIVENIFAFIKAQGEMGASAAVLRSQFTDKIFLHKVLKQLNIAKMVMQTGVCEIVFVHWKFIKPWIVNTYHLKRLDREAVEPSIKDHILINADAAPAKRKLSAAGLDEPRSKKSKASDEDKEKMDVDPPLPDEQNTTSMYENTAVTVSMTVGEPTTTVSSSQDLSDSEEPSEALSQDPSEGPSEAASEGPLEAASEGLLEGPPKGQSEGSSDGPSGSTPEGLSEGPLEGSSENTIGSPSEGPTEGPSEVQPDPAHPARKSSRLPRNVIPFNEQIDSQYLPQTKNTFPLKMAPWIRVNGSVNRRVLDKYAGTVLLHCIENVGTTLFSLCTRFHYLFPVHVQELIQYLEEFGCVTQTSMVIPDSVTLYSEYKGIEMSSTTILDDFKSVFIEPTLDAVTKMTIFIGAKKYKEDFI